MNGKKLHNLIDFYIQKEEKIHATKKEGYKWDILSSIRDEINDYVKRHYKNGTWDQDYSDFSEFTRKTIGKTGNLVYSYSRSVMQRAADKYPERVRKMFIDLSELNSAVSLEARIYDFISSLDSIAEENSDISPSGGSFHHDYRSISVYLFMMHPDRYYNYMYSTFSNFAKYVELEIPQSGDVHLLLEYYKACNEIEQILRRDYGEWFESYLRVQKSGDPKKEMRTDICGHLLIQDIVYSLHYYNNQEWLASDKDTIVYPTEFKKKPIRRIAVPNDGVIRDYEAKHRHNTVIGEAAERFVLDNEKMLVASYGFNPDLVRHISKEQGDGLGYDILSCDKDGKEIFIEVKGTSGGAGTAFYITEPELQCSIQHSEKYRLYRVYNFTSSGTAGTGRIAVIEGSLERYCINPILYKAVF